MNVKKLRPLYDALVVDDNMWLREKRGETLGDVELFGALPSVFCAARTPAVKERASAMKLPDMRDDSWNRYALASGGANQSVVNIDVDAKLATHRSKVAFLSRMWTASLPM